MNQTVNHNISDRVLSDISLERTRQDKKWGQQNHGHYKWLTILGEEYGESCKEALEAEFSRKSEDHREANRRETLLRKELVEVAAAAVAAIESLDRSWTEPVPSVRGRSTAVETLKGNEIRLETKHKIMDTMRELGYEVNDRFFFTSDEHVVMIVTEEYVKKSDQDLLRAFVPANVNLQFAQES